ncbi:MAG TPA: protein kinase, partial [Nannocystaceae bacterium]|nr:protein kinase [Nannocystaceae bacterium]
KLEWTAPEARAGEGWSGKSDVFSLGIVMFRVLTGKMPFERGGAAGSAARPVLEVAPRCPRGLALAIDAALAVDPAMRPDASGLVEELEVVAAELAAVEGADLRSGALGYEEGETIRQGVGAGGPASASERRVGSAIGGAASRAGAAAGSGTAPVRTEERRERWRWRAIYAVGAFGILYVGFLVGVMVDVGSRSADGAAMVVASVPAAGGVPSAVSVPAGGVPMLDGPSVSTGTLVSPLAAIEAAVPALRGCAAMAGEAVMIEVSIEAGRETVVKGEALGHDVDAVGACVRTVAAGLRFAAPMKAETLMKEVQP